MPVTLSGIMVVLHPFISTLLFVSMIALQPFLLSYTGLSGETTILVRFFPENILFSMLVTLAGIVTLVRLSQPENAN